MSWVKFPNQANKLLTLKRALKEAAALTPAQIRDDGDYGYRLLREGVIRSGKSEAELRALPPGDQSPRTTARALRELFRLCGFMEEGGGGITLTEEGQRLASFEDPVGEGEKAIWLRALADLKFPHHDFPELSSSGVEIRPLHVALRMLEPGPLPSQGLSFAFSAKDESDEEVASVRDLAQRWNTERGPTLAQEVGTTVSELRNNAKVFPGLLEQLGLIQRQSGVASITPTGINLLGAAPEAAAGGSEAGMALPASRPVNAEDGTAWTPAPIDPEDVAEKARLRLLRLERANKDHQTAVQILDGYLRERDFETSEADYDILAKLGSVWLLVEVKSLGMASPRRQVMSAIGQIAFYRALSIGNVPLDVTLYRIVFFDRPTDDARARKVLQTEEILYGWVEPSGECIFTPEATEIEGLVG